MTENEQVIRIIRKAIDPKHQGLDGYWYCEACGVFHARDEDCYD